MRKATVLLPVLGLGFACAGLGDFNRTTGLIDMPTAEWLDRNVIRVITNTTFAVGKDDYPSHFDLGLGYGLLGKGEIGLSAYTRNDYSAHLALRLTDEKGSIPALALGVQELTYRRWISPVGGGDTVGFPDDLAYLRDGGRPSERFSLYVVGTKGFARRGAFTAGIGRGRFVGYGPHSRWFNTDNYRQGDMSGPAHTISELAFGLFMGVRWELRPGFLLMLEYDGRDGNAGVKYKHKYFELGLAGTHLDQIGGKPRLNPRIALGLSANNSWLYEVSGEGIIACRVVDAGTNRPIAATISFPGMQIPSLRASDQGIFKLKVPAGNYMIQAGKDGYQRKQLTLTVFRGRTAKCDFALEPEVAPEVGEGLLACRVVDGKTDVPLVATISFLGTSIPQLSTSSDGLLQVRVPAGTYSIEAGKEGYHASRSGVTVERGRTVALNFALEPEEAGKEQLIKEHLNRGLSHFAADSLFEAASEWANVLRLDPSHEEAKRLLSRIRQLIRGDMVDSHKTKAFEYASQGDLRKALEEWELILTLDPDNVEARTQTESLRERLEPRPSRARVDSLFREGLSLFLAEKYEEAVEVFNSVLKLDATHKEALDYRDRAVARLKAIKGE